MLGGLLSNIASGIAIGRVKAATRPNPYAPKLPAQAAAAVGQAGYGLKPGESGLAGSEADYYLPLDLQGRSGAPIAQDVTSRPMPPSTYVPGDPGADGRPTVTRDFYTGPLGAVVPWGANTGNRPTVLPATMLPPTAVAPSARQMEAAREAATIPDALDSAWDS